MSILDKASLIQIPSGYKSTKLYSLRPSNGTGDFTFARSSSGTRVNSEGLIETAQVLGSEEVTNGDFATDSNWTKGTGWTISGGKANASSATSDFTQSISFTLGKTYKVNYTISNYSSGSVRVLLGAYIAGTTRNSNGTFTELITPTNPSSNSLLYLEALSGFNGSIDNVSVKEVIKNDVPRLDYSGGASCASLLLEGQSTNLVTYSEDFSQWNNTDITIGANGTSPSGETNANLIQTGSAGSDQVNETFTISATNTATYSVFIKRVSGAEWVDFLVVKAGFANSLKVWFNIKDGLVGSNVENGTTAFDNASVKDFGNGWYRLKVTTTDTTNNTSFNIRVRTASANASDTRVDNSSYYLWGAQLESQSFITSYIPTSGSTVTRTADVCNNAGTSATFNSTEGVLFAEIAALADENSNRYFSLNDGSANNRIRFGYTTPSNSVRLLVVASSIQVDITEQLSNTSVFNKIAIKYKQNDFALWVNGVEIATDTSGNTPSGLSQLDFDNAAGGDIFYGKTKQLMVFDEALSDEELSDLTGQANLSFNNLATFYGYTIL